MLLTFLLFCVVSFCFGEVRVAHLFTFLCCVILFWRGSCCSPFYFSVLCHFVLERFVLLTFLLFCVVSFCFGEVRVAHLFTFLCCDILFWRGSCCSPFYFSVLCHFVLERFVLLTLLLFCVVSFCFGEVRVAHLFTFLCCVILFWRGSCCSPFYFSVLCHFVLERFVLLTFLLFCVVSFCFGEVRVAHLFTFLCCVILFWRGSCCSPFYFSVLCHFVLERFVLLTFLLFCVVSFCFGEVRVAHLFTFLCCVILFWRGSCCSPFYFSVLCHFVLERFVLLTFLLFCVVSFCFGEVRVAHLFTFLCCVILFWRGSCCSPFYFSVLCHFVLERFVLLTFLLFCVVSFCFGEVRVAHLFTFLCCVILFWRGSCCSPFYFSVLCHFVLERFVLLTFLLFCVVSFCFGEVRVAHLLCCDILFWRGSCCSPFYFSVLCHFVLERFVLLTLLLFCVVSFCFGEVRVAHLFTFLCCVILFWRGSCCSPFYFSVLCHFVLERFVLLTFLLFCVVSFCFGEVRVAHLFTFLCCVILFWRGSCCSPFYFSVLCHFVLERFVLLTFLLFCVVSFCFGEVRVAHLFTFLCCVILFWRGSCCSPFYFSVLCHFVLERFVLLTFLLFCVVSFCFGEVRVAHLFTFLCCVILFWRGSCCSPFYFSVLCHFVLERFVLLTFLLFCVVSFCFGEVRVAHLFTFLCCVILFWRGSCCSPFYFSVLCHFVLERFVLLTFLLFCVVSFCFGEVRVAHLFTFLCCVILFWRGSCCSPFYFSVLCHFVLERFVLLTLLLFCVVSFCFACLFCVLYYFCQWIFILIAHFFFFFRVYLID